MMSKKRLLDSRIRSSQTFAKLTYRQRDLWQGLIAVADDQGRMPGLAAYVRSQVWPYDDIALAEVDNDLQQLKQLEMITIYQAAGQVFIQLINWWKYQSPQWAGPSDYPAPPGWIDRTRYHGAEHKVITENWDCNGGYTQSPDLPPDLSASKSDKERVWQDVNEDVKGDKEALDSAAADMGTDTGAKGAPVESAYLSRIAEATASGIAANSNGNKPDLSTYPEEVRPYLEAICELWHLKPPRSATSKGFWIKQAREVADACGEFGIEAIRAYRTEFESYMGAHDGLAPHTVEGPASLVKVIRAAAGRLREGGMAARPLKQASEFLWAKGQPITFESEVARLEHLFAAPLDSAAKQRIADDFKNGEYQKGELYA